MLLPCPRFGVRHAQAIGIFFAVFISYCLRSNLSITIVAMLDPNANANRNIPTFNWTNRNVILSAFFWGYVIPQALAGWLMNRYGPKWFLVCAMSSGTFIGFLIPPLAIKFGSTAVIICKVLQGLSLGFVLPSVSCFISKWIPENERGRVGTFIYSGGPLGTVFSIFTGGVLAASWYGWPTVFYFTSVLGVAWCFLYAVFGRNSPGEHPSISSEEKTHIEETSSIPKKKHLATPWKEILTSAPFLALLYSYTCFIFGYWVMLTQIPTYMSKIMKMDLKANAILSALPYTLHWLVSLILSIISDKLTNKRVLSISMMRKITTSIGLLSPAFALILLNQCSEESKTYAVILLIISVGLNGACLCGPFINNVDLSPNHAGTMYGIINGLANILAILAPLLVQIIVTDEHNINQWRTVFYLTSIAYCTGSVVFIILGSGKIQPWNNYTKEGVPQEQETT